MAKKSQAKMFPYRKDDADLFKDVVFLVECTHHEQFVFWQDYYDNPKFEKCAIEDWEQEGMGYGITIGELDDRPICVSIWWEWLEGYRVMFYEATSQVVDHAMVDKWIKHFSKDIKCDNNTRWAHCDSSNFHHCVHAIQDLVKKKGKGPGNPRGRGPRFMTTKERKALEASKNGNIQIDKKIRDLIALAIDNPNSNEGDAAAMKVCKKLKELLK